MSGLPLWHGPPQAAGFDANRTTRGNQYAFPYAPYNAYDVGIVGQKNFATDEMKSFFSVQVQTTISEQITKYLEGVHPEGRKIVIAPQVLLDLMSNTYTNQRGAPKDMMNIVIARAVAQVKDEFEITEQNSKLNKWVIQYNQDPRWGLRQHDVVKVNERPLNRGVNWNY